MDKHDFQATKTFWRSHQSVGRNDRNFQVKSDESMPSNSKDTLTTLGLSQLLVHLAFRQNMSHHSISSYISVLSLGSVHNEGCGDLFIVLGTSSVLPLFQQRKVVLYN